MNLNQIVVNHLKIYGFDGLFCPGECACEIDDLAPCEHSDFKLCKPGYKVPCPNSEHCDCDKPIKGECWRIQSEKLEQPEEQSA